MSLLAKLFAYGPAAGRRNLMRDLALRALRTDSKRPRKPPEAGLAFPAVPPRGPVPLQGGAEAPLDLEN